MVGSYHFFIIIEYGARRFFVSHFIRIKAVVTACSVGHLVYISIIWVVSQYTVANTYARIYSLLFNCERLLLLHKVVILFDHSSIVKAWGGNSMLTRECLVRKRRWKSLGIIKHAYSSLKVRIQMYKGWVIYWIMAFEKL